MKRLDAGGSTAFRIIRCVDWLRKRGQAVNQELWDGVYEIATNPDYPARTRLRARQVIADRIDPKPTPAPPTASPTAISIVIVSAAPSGPNGHPLRESETDGQRVRIVSSEGPSA